MKLLKNLIKKVMPKYRLSASEQSEANNAAVVCMVKTMVAVQVKVTYGLSFGAVSGMFNEQAASLSASAETEGLAVKDKAQLLHMSALLDSVAGELKMEGAKSGKH